MGGKERKVVKPDSAANGMSMGGISRTAYLTPSFNKKLKEEIWGANNSLRFFSSPSTRLAVAIVVGVKEERKQQAKRERRVWCGKEKTVVRGKKRQISKKEENWFYTILLNVTDSLKYQKVVRCFSTFGNLTFFGCFSSSGRKGARVRFLRGKSNSEELI